MKSFLLKLRAGGLVTLLAIPPWYSAQALSVIGPLTVESGITNHVAAYASSRGGSDPFTYYTMQVDSPPSHGQATITTFSHALPPYTEEILSYIDVEGNVTLTSHTYEVQLVVLPPPPLPVGPLEVPVGTRTTLFDFLDDRNGFEPLSIISLTWEAGPMHGTVDLFNGGAPGRPSYRSLVSYTPDSGYEGSDQFVLVVGLVTRVFPVGLRVGTTNRYAVNLRVGNPPIAGIPSLSLDGACQFTLHGTLPGLEYRIDSSTDMMNWVPLTNLTATGSSIEVRDPTAAEHPQRSYRSQKLP